MKTPSNWKGSLSRDENKKTLTSFFISEIQADSFAPLLFKGGEDTPGQNFLFINQST